MPVNTQDLVFIDEPISQPQQSEGIGQYLGRQALGGLQKVSEAPFAINELLREVGQKLPATAPLFKGVKSAQEAIGIPTAQEFRRGSEKALGYQPEAFDPKNIGERILQEGISTGALTALTGGVGTAINQIKPIIGAAIGGNVFEEIGNLLNLPDEVQGLMHLGGSLLGSTAGTRSKVGKAYKANYDKADKALPASATVQSKKSIELADKLLERAEKFPGYEKIQPTVQQFRNLGANQGKFNVRDAQEFKKRLNELWAGYPRDIRREFVNPIIDSIKNDVIKEYGKTNKAFLEPWLTAEKDFAAMQGGLVKLDRMKDTASKIAHKYSENPEKLGKYAKIGLNMALYGGSGAASYLWHPLAAGIGATTFTAGQLNKFANLVKNSPTAQKLMNKSITDLMAGNSNAAIHSLNKLDEELGKNDPMKDLVFI